jgi:hypothetical protein
VTALGPRQRRRRQQLQQRMSGCQGCWRLWVLFQSSRLRTGTTRWSHAYDG